MIRERKSREFSDEVTPGLQARLIIRKKSRERNTPRVAKVLGAAMKRPAPVIWRGADLSEHRRDDGFEARAYFIGAESVNWIDGDGLLCGGRNLCRKTRRSAAAIENWRSEIGGREREHARIFFARAAP